MAKELIAPCGCVICEQTTEAGKVRALLRECGDLRQRGMDYFDAVYMDIDRDMEFEDRVEYLREAVETWELSLWFHLSGSNEPRSRGQQRQSSSDTSLVVAGTPQL